jgi:hypothetical protein
MIAVGVMKVGDLVRSSGNSLVPSGWIGLVMESEPDIGGSPGFWIEYVEDHGNWKWYSNHDYGDSVEVISAS